MSKIHIQRKSWNQLQFKSTNQKVFHAKVRSKVQQYFMFQFTKCVEVSAVIPLSDVPVTLFIQ